jgi:CheY-like chemotaxis protein
VKALRQKGLIEPRSIPPKLLITLVIYVRVTGITKVEHMTLSSMVVSRDWQEVSVLECILGSLHMDVTVENDPQRAHIRLTKSKIDALIVDCDLQGSAQFLERLHRAEMQANTVPLVIMGAPDCNHRLDETGAMFAFEKPISVEQAVRTLSAARSMILDGRLRYHRAGLEVPVSVSCEGGKSAEGYLVNVSQGGMQIHSKESFENETPLQISFELPGVKTRLKAQAEIAWQDQKGNLGVKFVKVTPRQQKALQLWLAQQYFAN